MKSLAALLVVVLAVLGRVAAQSPQWQVGTADKVTSIVGVHSTSANEVYGAFLNNGYGSGLMYSDDFATTSQQYGPMGLMNMDVAITKDGSTGCIASVGQGLLVGPAKSDQYKKVADVRAVTQNVELYLENGFVSAGEFRVGTRGSVFNGVAYSTDAGSTWSYSDIGLNSSAYIARYASFPSESSWYVSSGTFPVDSSSEVRRSVNLVFGEAEGGKTSLQFKRALRSKAGESTGYPGAISRSTDQGKTWTKVHDTDGNFYMNQISCADDTHCVAVGENGDSAYVLTTTDGNKWYTSLTAPAGISLIAAKALFSNEFWVAGGGQDGRQLTGYYYHTTDAGANWELTKLPGYVIDLSFTSSNNGYSAFLTNAYSTFAVYK